MHICSLEINFPNAYVFMCILLGHGEYCRMSDNEEGKKPETW